MSTDTITVALCTSGHRATKRIRAATDPAGFIVEGYDAGKYFAVHELSVADIYGLARTLDLVASDPRTFVLRGEPLPGIDRTRCRRLLYTHEDGTPPTFREAPRRWVVIDFDEVPGSDGLDPRDGTAAAIHCRGLLPEPWRPATCWWGLSSSAGFKPGVRIKLAFWLDRPVLGKELERHLKGAPIDPSTLRAIQPIYVARPILVGVADPIRQRTGLEPGRDEQVGLPELPHEEARPAAATHSVDGRRYVSGSTAAAAWHRLEGLCRAIERAGKGRRHGCLIWAAKRAVEIDDAIPRAEIADELIAAARRAGLEDAEAELARQVKNGFRIGIFGPGSN